MSIIIINNNLIQSYFFYYKKKKNDFSLKDIDFNFKRKYIETLKFATIVNLNLLL
jgi:hypothetical protein